MPLSVDPRPSCPTMKDGKFELEKPKVSKSVLSLLFYAIALMISLGCLMAVLIIDILNP